MNSGRNQTKNPEHDTSYLGAALRVGKPRAGLHNEKLVTRKTSLDGSRCWVTGVKKKLKESQAYPARFGSRVATLLAERKRKPISVD